MLKRLSGRNFACFGKGDYHLDLAPETAIIGPNNVGKSALIAAFNFVRSNGIGASRSGGLLWNSPTYNWGNYRNIVHRHETDRVIEASAVLDHKTNLVTVDAKIKDESIESSISPHLTPSELRDDIANIWYFHASRREIPSGMGVGPTGFYTSWQQPIEPDGSNVVTYLLERFTSRDERWAEAEKWLKRIAPESSILKSPLRGNTASVEITQADSGIDVNVAYQGTGIQKALVVIAGLVFSPEGSTIIVEEPEIHLHKRSQEGLADLFNLAVNDWKKQVVFTTHSVDMLLPFISDVGKEPTKRGKDHIKAKPENFSLVEFRRVDGDIEIKPLDIKQMMWTDFKAHIDKTYG